MIKSQQERTRLDGLSFREGNGLHHAIGFGFDFHRLVGCHGSHQRDHLGHGLQTSLHRHHLKDHAASPLGRNRTGRGSRLAAAGDPTAHQGQDSVGDQGLNEALHAESQKLARVWESRARSKSDRLWRTQASSVCPATPHHASR